MVRGYHVYCDICRLLKTRSFSVLYRFHFYVHQLDASEATDPNVATLCEYNFHHRWTWCGLNRDCKQCIIFDLPLSLLYVSLVVYVHSPEIISKRDISNSKDPYAVIIERELSVTYLKISIACSLFLQRGGSIKKAVLMNPPFQLILLVGVSIGVLGVYIHAFMIK